MFSVHYPKNSGHYRYQDESVYPDVGNGALTYIRNNQMMIPNYGEMRRYGEPVSTAFVESTINEVIARRMAKKQQMQWSRKGAHYLLQTRTAVLNNELQDKFTDWYPGFQCDGKVSVAAA